MYVECLECISEVIIQVSNSVSISADINLVFTVVKAVVLNPKNKRSIKQYNFILRHCLTIKILIKLFNL